MSDKKTVIHITNGLDNPYAIELGFDDEGRANDFCKGFNSKRYSRSNGGMLLEDDGSWLEGGSTGYERGVSFLNKFVTMMELNRIPYGRPYAFVGDLNMKAYKRVVGNMRHLKKSRKNKELECEE